eukprot:3806255-Prymnesium_polylepis.1
MRGAHLVIDGGHQRHRRAPDHQTACRLDGVPVPAVHCSAAPSPARQAAHRLPSAQPQRGKNFFACSE